MGQNIRSTNHRARRGIPSQYRVYCPLFFYNASQTFR